MMERARFFLGRKAPAIKRTLIPSTLSRGTPRAAALRSFYIQYSLCSVLLPSHYVFRTHCQLPAVPDARALA